MIQNLLLISSLSLEGLIEDYRIFFLSILPSMFILACVLEYFDRLNVFGLVKRALVSVLILTSITSFYKVSIDYSIKAAEDKLQDQRGQNILLMDLFDASKYLDSNKETKISGVFGYLKHHFFTSFINDSFTIGVYFFSQLGFLILKVVYSLIYYLGYGLIGIPCLLYLFPTMGNVLRGGVLSYVCCLIVPHILVFLLSLISSEISSGYTQGQVIGGSVLGTAMLFVLSFFIALTPFIAMMIINGSGIAQAGGIISMAATNMIKGIPSTGLNTASKLLTGQSLGPKGAIVMGTAKFASRETARGARLLTNKIKGGLSESTKINKYGADSSKSKATTNANSSSWSNSKSNNTRNSNTSPSKERNTKEVNSNRDVSQKYARNTESKSRSNTLERKTHKTDRRQSDQSRKSSPNKRVR